MYRMKYIFGEMVRYNGQLYKIMGIRFAIGGVQYKLKGIYGWVKEGELTK